MTRLVLSSLRAIGLAAAAVCAASALLPPAVAATKAAKPAPKSGAKEEASKPSLVATFGDWNVFVGEVGKGRICYTLAQPKSREPASSSVGGKRARSCFELIGSTRGSVSETSLK